MTTPIRRSAYLPYYEVLDRALDSPNGLRIECTEMGDAYQYRVRLNRARTLDQNLNRMSREPNDPRYGISDYDNLIVQVKEEEDGKWWVYLKHNRIDNHIEELPPKSRAPTKPEPVNGQLKFSTRRMVKL